MISRRAAGAAAAIACLAALTLTGCAGDAPTAPQARSTAPVIAPGEPGEEARTLAPGEAVTAVPTATANAADVAFMRDMVIHHRQAIDMSLMAPERAASEPLKRFAARIKDVQELEIAAITSWLRQQGQKAPDHHTGHQDMPGMATPKQLDQLRAAEGAAFDRLFVELMTTHHRGALTMINEVLTDGSHVRVQELAEDMAVSQAAEINRLARL